jgi:Protein of unknown function (DUF3606)
MADDKTKTDDKTKQDARDRSSLAGGQDYEVEYFAKHHGISVEQARGLIEKFGDNKQVLDREAWKLRSGG